MTELAKHIEVLLLSNDCVIVPEFGGFMAHHAHSVFVDDENLFIPPSRTIGFNPQLTLNDSLLAQSYVETYDISYPEALRKIEEDVNVVRQSIANEGFCELEGIGLLSLNEDGNYDFSPMQAGILTPSLYALDGFEFKPLCNIQLSSVEDSQESNAESAGKNEIPFALVSNDETEHTAGDVEDEDEDGNESGERAISIRLETIKHVVTAAAVFLLLLLIATPLGESKSSKAQLCSVDSEMLYRMMPGMEVNGEIKQFMHEETAQKDTISILQDTLVRAKADTKVDTVPTANVVTDNSEKYVIVLASCVAKPNAEDFVRKLAKQGVADARVIETANRKVVCGNYKSDSEAAQGLRKLRNIAGFEEAWVMKTNK